MQKIFRAVLHTIDPWRLVASEYTKDYPVAYRIAGLFGQRGREMVGSIYEYVEKTYHFWYPISEPEVILGGPFSCTCVEENVSHPNRIHDTRGFDWQVIK